MTRITETQVKDLIEAYTAVYAPQELTEEQVWEEVENWVNSLLEEGYDLSDYTWEEMYEGYLTEILGMPGAQNFGANLRQQVGSARRAVGGAIVGGASRVADTVGSGLRGYAGQTTTSRNPEARAINAVTRGVSAPARAVTSAIGGFATGQRASKPAAAAPPAKPPGSGGPPIRPVPGNERAPAPRQQAPAPRQQAPAPARPAARPAAPATASEKPQQTTSTTAPAAPSKPSLRSDVADLQAMRARSQVRQGLNPSTGNTSADSRARAARASVNSSFDPFDVIKGHLLDEGYADTEEAATAIMANMSEEWKEIILGEDDKSYDRNRRRAAQRAAARNEARRRGQTGNVPGVGWVSPRPERETYRDSSGVERHTSGARMPKPKKEG